MSHLLWVLQEVPPCCISGRIRLRGEPAYSTTQHIIISSRPLTVPEKHTVPAGVTIWRLVTMMHLCQPIHNNAATHFTAAGTRAHACTSTLAPAHPSPHTRTSPPVPAPVHAAQHTLPGGHLCLEDVVDVGDEPSSVGRAVTGGAGHSACTQNSKTQSLHA